MKQAGHRFYAYPCDGRLKSCVACVIASWPTSVSRDAGQQCRHHPRHDVQENGQGELDAVIRTNLDSCFSFAG
jgi:hypothetical protein